jgi:hypothetical protein
LPIIEDFLQLPTSEKQKVLSSVNSDFNSLPDEEKTKVINSIESGSLEVARLFEQGQIEKDTPEYTQAQKIYLAAKPYVEPLAEAGALVGGGIVGAPVGGPIGAVTGAGLAFGGVKQLFNFIETSLGLREAKGYVGELAEAGEEVLTGAAYEAGGQAIRPAISLLARQRPAAMEAARELKPPKFGIALREKTAKTEAARRVEVETLGTEITQPQIQRNIAAAKELEGRIPGLKFTQGQLTNDASAIALERSLARHGGQDLSQSQRTEANRILRTYYANKAVGTGRVEDFTKQVTSTRQELEASTKQAEQAVSAEVNRLGRHLDEQTIGREITGRLSAGKKAAREQATKLYNKIPDIKVPTDDLLDDLIKIENEYDKVMESPANFPSRLVKGLRKKLRGPFGAPNAIRFQELRKLRSQLLSEIRTAQGSATPNEQYIRRLQMILKGPDEKILGGVEGTINSLEGEAGKAGDLYRKASSFYREYAGKYKQGTVADVLQRGRRGEDTKIAMANIAREFYTLDSIDDFTRAIGNDAIAKTAMKDYVSFDLLNAAKDPATGNLVTRKSMQWLSKNSGKLKKLGIYDEYKNVVSMQRNADLVNKNLDIFNKSVAGRVLEGDTDDIIRNAFRGSRNYAQTAQQLMNQTKGNPAAQAGLKKAFSEYLLKESETTGLEFFQIGRAETPAEIEFTKSIAKFTKQVRKMAPAMRVMYKDEPEKLRAIHNTWKAYQTISRTAKSAMIGGSDTAENLAFKTFRDVVVGGAKPGFWYPYKAIRDTLNKLSNKHVEVYLRRAMFDPEYAANLMAMAKARRPTPEQSKNFNRLMTLIAYEIGEEGGQ